MAKRKITWRRRYTATSEYETCPDCSERDAVSFTFGHLSRRSLDEPQAITTGEPVVSFARSERGLSRTRGCETCGGSGRVRIMRDTAIPASN